VPEGANIEIAQHLDEHGHGGAAHGLMRDRTLEIVEGVVLALVAVATAWSGYQAAKWDGSEAELYGTSSRIRLTAEGLLTRGGQQQLYDSSTASSWLQAKATGNERLADIYARRVRPEVRPVFDLWIKMDPIHNPHAPAGVITMPQYHNRLLSLSAKLQARATGKFEEGTAARETGDKYIRATVLLATVLFLIALTQRFKLFGVRLGLFGVALVLLAIGLYWVASYPRIY
jgi:hypothetical protein